MHCNNLSDMLECPLMSSTSADAGGVNEGAAPVKPIPKLTFKIVDQILAITDPMSMVLETMREHGDTFEVPSPTGPMVLTGDPEVAKAIFTADHDQFGIPFR